MRKIIAVDIDGVIFDLCRRLYPLIEERFGVRLVDEDVQFYNIDLVLGLREGEVYGLICGALMEEPILIVGAKEGMEELYSFGDVFIVTSRDGRFSQLTREQLDGCGIPYDRLIFTDGVKASNGLRPDVVVDDCLSECIAWGSLPNPPLTLLFDQPWNRSLNVCGRFRRVETWREIVEAVKGLSG